MDKKGNSGECAHKPLVISKKQWLLKRPDIDEMAKSGGSALKKDFAFTASGIES